MTKQLIDLVLGEIEDKVTPKEFSEVKEALQNYDDILEAYESLNPDHDL